MHIEKNVCDAILGTLMNIQGKTKDVKAVRDYFECKGLRSELWPQVMVSKKRNRGEELCGSGKGKGSKKMSNIKNWLQIDHTSSRQSSTSTLVYVASYFRSPSFIE